MENLLYILISIVWIGIGCIITLQTRVLAISLTKINTDRGIYKRTKTFEDLPGWSLVIGYTISVIIWPITFIIALIQTDKESKKMFQ